MRDADTDEPRERVWPPLAALGALAVGLIAALGLKFTDVPDNRRTPLIALIVLFVVAAAVALVLWQWAKGSIPLSLEALLSLDKYERVRRTVTEQNREVLGQEGLEGFSDRRKKAEDDNKTWGGTPTKARALRDVERQRDRLLGQAKGIVRRTRVRWLWADTIVGMLLFIAILVVALASSGVTSVPGPSPS